MCRPMENLPLVEFNSTKLRLGDERNQPPKGQKRYQVNGSDVKEVTGVKPYRNKIIGPRTAPIFLTVLHRYEGLQRA